MDYIYTHNFKKMGPIKLEVMCDCAWPYMTRLDHYIEVDLS